MFDKNIVDKNIIELCIKCVFSTRNFRCVRMCKAIPLVNMNFSKNFSSHFQVFHSMKFRNEYTF